MRPEISSSSPFGFDRTSIASPSRGVIPVNAVILLPCVTKTRFPGPLKPEITFLTSSVCVASLLEPAAVALSEGRVSDFGERKVKRAVSTALHHWLVKIFVTRMPRDAIRAPIRWACWRPRSVKLSPVVQSPAAKSSGFSESTDCWLRIRSTNPPCPSLLHAASVACAGKFPAIITIAIAMSAGTIRFKKLHIVFLYGKSGDVRQVKIKGRVGRRSTCIRPQCNIIRIHGPS